MYLNQIKVHLWWAVFNSYSINGTEKANVYLWFIAFLCQLLYRYYLLSVMLTYTPLLWSPSGLTPKM